MADWHGVNGVSPLPILPVPFEPWPLHTEGSLTPRGPRLLAARMIAGERLRGCSQLNGCFTISVATLQGSKSQPRVKQTPVCLCGNQNTQMRLTGGFSSHRTERTVRQSGAGLRGGSFQAGDVLQKLGSETGLMLDLRDAGTGRRDSHWLIRRENQSGSERS